MKTTKKTSIMNYFKFPFKNLIFLLLIGFLFFINGFGQDLITNSGRIEFVSNLDTDIKAISQSLTSKINISKRSIIVSIPIQGFRFEKAKMQSKFNSSEVMDSSKYPKAKFMGSIISNEDLSKEGVYNIKLVGNIELRGISNEFSCVGELTIKAKQLSISLVFNIDGSKHGVKMKYGNEMEIKLYVQYEKI